MMSVRPDVRNSRNLSLPRSGATVAVAHGIRPPATLAEPFAGALPCAAEYCRDFLAHLQHLSPSRYGSIAVFRIINLSKCGEGGVRALFAYGSIAIFRLMSRSIPTHTHETG